MTEAKTVSILGCGWYGFSLATAFIQKGLSVNGSTTSANKLQILAAADIQPYLVNFGPDNELYDAQFFKCDVLFICIPPNVRTGDGKDYLNTVQRVVDAIISSGVEQVVFISSTGVYGDVNEEVNELSEPKPDSASGKALLQAEETLKNRTEFTTTIIRFAGLIGPGREPGRFLAGKKAIPNGNAPVNLIHLTDCIGISLALLDKGAFGNTYNACSPGHPTRSDFYTKAALCAGLEKPDFLNEKKDWKIISSLHVNSILNYKYQVTLLMQ